MELATELAEYFQPWFPGTRNPPIEHDVIEQRKKTIPVKYSTAGIVRNQEST